ncbi:MAG TPA: hypothetical protein DCG19_06905 [Cryomorphaceae bacterium]|nr:hypothetical protein [Owenweeksia sp.]MBF99387.1 hypothetical protein [Owenweeksia sp.]HAD97118.1 hypothetical protein [Cryomorphaceae bacterium]HBF19461.1 hypothetical protein [Cryomorphaceae bacterium]|tara:strand:+ start:129 stop:353 length:225 start_codon:yes stop_codon:yes gene_type:complete
MVELENIKMLPKPNVPMAVTNAIIAYDMPLFFDGTNVCTSQKTDVTKMTVVVTEMKNVLSAVVWAWFMLVSRVS